MCFLSYRIRIGTSQNRSQFDGRFVRSESATISSYSFLRVPRVFFEFIPNAKQIKNNKIRVGTHYSVCAYKYLHPYSVRVCVCVYMRAVSAEN